MNKKFFLIILFISLLLGFVFRMKLGAISGYEYATTNCSNCGKYRHCRIYDIYKYADSGRYSEYYDRTVYVCSTECEIDLQNSDESMKPKYHR